MSDELKAAAERLIEGEYYGDGGNLIDAIRYRRADGVMVARAYLADLATREAEQLERALPIDGDWLERIGFVDKGTAEKPYSSISNEYHSVEVKTLFVRLIRNSSGIGITIGEIQTTTRGMMLDFLAGLKIPTQSVA